MAKGPIPIAEFTKAVRENIGKEARLSVMRGYVGESEIDGNLRLYRDATMRTFVELPEAAIAHHQEVPNSELGEVFVWVDLDSDMPDTKPAPRKLGDLLEGSIARDLGGLAAAGLGAGFAAATTPRICQDGDVVAVTPRAATTPRQCVDPTDFPALTPLFTGTTPRNCPVATDIGRVTPVLTVTTPRNCPVPALEREIPARGGPIALSIAVCSLNECTDVC